MMPAISAEPAKPRAHLEFWVLVRTSISWNLIGFVFGHARLPDRQLIVTSDLVKMHPLPSRLVELETVNTFYSLGRPRHPDLDDDYRELLDEIIGDKKWQVAELDDLRSLAPRC